MRKDIVADIIAGDNYLLAQVLAAVFPCADNCGLI